jgi:acyl carrier protein
MSIRSEITAQFEQVAREQDKRLEPLTDDAKLIDLGLNSLCFAVIVVRLEDTLGLNPFETAEHGFPSTWGEFVKFYEDAA